MNHQTLVAMGIIGHTLASVSAIVGAVFLAYHDKPGWGWLIFLAVCLGSYSVTKGQT